MHFSSIDCTPVYRSHILVSKLVWKFCYFTNGIISLWWMFLLLLLFFFSIWCLMHTIKKRERKKKKGLTNSTEMKGQSWSWLMCLSQVFKFFKLCITFNVFVDLTTNYFASWNGFGTSEKSLWKFFFFSSTFFFFCKQSNARSFF